MPRASFLVEWSRKDDGRTWIHEKDIEPDTVHTYCYVSTEFVGEQVVLSYYRGGLETPLQSLRIARVPLAWLYE